MRFIYTILALTAPLLTSATNVTFTSLSTAGGAVRAKFASALKDSINVINETQPFPYIIGGEVAGTNEFPWFGRTTITIYDGVFFYQYTCGASLIHQDVAVSAAHCVVDELLSNPGVSFDIQFYLGANEYDGSDGVEYLVETVIWPDTYSEESNANDIAFYKLTLSSSVQPVPWNSNPSIPSVGDFGTAIGFGDTSEGGENSPVLLKVELPVITNAECDEFFIIDVDESFVCAYTPGKSTCNGDSGGPIITQSGVLFGVTSFGPAAGCDTGPAGFTRVSFFSDFIDLVSQASTDQS